MYSSKITADSLAPHGIRVLSYEVTYPSNLHAEVVSNRELSVTAAGGNLQKPISTTRAIITGTHLAFSKFFARYICANSDTMWALQSLADLMRDQMRTQESKALDLGDWHLPYLDLATLEDANLVAIDKAERMCAVEHGLRVTMICRMLSTVRCHFVEMRKPEFPVKREFHEHRMDFYVKELDTYGKLVADLLRYGSAFEHQATPDALHEGAFVMPAHHGNLRGWEQHRMMFIEAPIAIEPAQPVTEEQQYHG
jgi:hypothetical protein